MKTLYVDTSLTGHHKSYLLSLMSSCETSFVALPKGKGELEISPESVLSMDYKSGSFFYYPKTIVSLNKIACKIKPDIVHILTCDAFYRYFGIGFRCIFPNAKIVVTCHGLRRGFFHDLSYRRIGESCDALVVHTDSIKKTLEALGVKNVYHIEYPQFGNSPIVKQEDALSKLGIKNNGKKVFLALGGTRRSKGLDILLEALKEVHEPFHMIIAGKEEDFKREYILENIKPYKENVTLLLEFLSDEKFSLCLDASDFIVLPYRKTFDGASGPLGEGVWHYKMIVGPDHKSLGEIIKSNHLGKTFKSEDVEDLRSTLCEVIKTEGVPDEKYLEYRRSLDPLLFQEKYKKLYTLVTSK